MTERTSTARALVAALIAAGLSYALALAVSWHLLAVAHGQPGAPSAELAWLALQDLPRRWVWGLLLLLAYALLAWPAWALHRRAAWPAAWVYPLAAMLAMALALFGPMALYGQAPLAGASEWLGAMLYLATGLLGGLFWAGGMALAANKGSAPG